MDDRQRLMAMFFAASACSWMPHWACHYYRLETGSSFAVGGWDFSRLDSAIALLIYSVFILANLYAVGAEAARFVVGTLSGALHIGFAALHAWRLIHPFRFVVFGYSWSRAASVREAIIVGIFGLCSLAVGLNGRRQ